MRVIAGNLGGRQFDSPKGHRTHPMADRVRGGLFNSLGDISGLTVLDAFAGSGALSFEAVSRGAENAVAIDIDKSAYQALANNISKLGIKDRVMATQANVSSWSNNNEQLQFDLVFTAPPYDSLQLSVVQKLARHVKKGGLYVLDWPGNLEPPLIESLDQIKQLGYGDAQLVFYRKTE